MIHDTLVVDAVIHPYDLAPANQDRSARPQLDSVYAAHRLAGDPDRREFTLTEEEFFTDFAYPGLASALFAESQVDLGIIRSLPNLGFCLGNVTDPWRAAAFRDEHPSRFRMFATVQTPVLDDAIAQLEAQVRDLDVIGLKVYPAFFYDGLGEGWRLDGPDYATPLLEAARDMGIRHVAVHTALWLPPAPKDAFRIDDLESPLDRFSDMTFQIVHAGTAFLDQTCELLARHPNTYATLETTFQFIVARPELFAKILSSMLAAAGSERLLYASGCNLMHPRPLLEPFAGYELPRELLEEKGIAQLTEQDRRNIFGENVMRLYGLDASELRQDLAGDAFAGATDAGFAEPWSVLRTAKASRR
ncbi:MAG TPA: amidohydrolase family protein [Solirubrobacteraceae bacterium]|jgi:hypothetical protein|nr:amidohydrolase family protein [Solirubrobacteraceae bacterium]